MAMKDLFRIFACAAIAGTLFSCQMKEEPFEPEKEDSLVPAGYVIQEFTATSEVTKTSMDDMGKTVWVSNDRIRVFWESGNTSADCISGEDSETAVFRAVIPDGTSVVYASYPEDIDVELNIAESEFEVTIPDQKDGQFANSNIAVAKVGSGNSLNFFNAGALLCIDIPGDDIKKVVVESVDGSALAGKQKLAYSGSSWTLGSQSDPKSSISMTIDGSGKKYLPILAGVTHAKGLLLKYYKDGDVLSGTYYLNKNITTQRNKVYKFGEFEPNGNYYVSVSGEGNKNGLSWDNALSKEKMLALISLTGSETDEVKAAKIAAIDGATFHLAAGTFDMGDIVTLGFPDATAPVVINFEGAASYQTVISGNETHRLFEFGNKVKATFTNIVFDKGRGYDSKISPIVANEGADLTFVNCKFTNCKNQLADESAYKTGGCFYAYNGSTLSFDGCEFSGNTGSYAATLAPYGKTVITNCSFHDNLGSNGPGSAIYIDHESVDCTVTNSEFKDNKVIGQDGGAIVIAHGSITMNGCTIEGNRIVNTSDSRDKRGAALRLVSSGATAKLVNCTVKDNVAKWGGAINVPAGTSLEIEGGTYQDNYANTGGCFLVTGDGALTVKDALIKGNYATNNSGGFGGALRQEGYGKITLKGCTFEENHTLFNGNDNVFGGAVSIYDGQSDAVVIIDGCTFIGNYSTAGAPALSYQSGSSGDKTGYMKVSNTRFEGNHCDYTGTNNSNYGRFGGAVRLGHDTTPSYFDNCTFVGNCTKTANKEVKSTYGGAVTFYADGDAYFNNCHFENNRATRGGAISAMNASGSGLFLNGCSFSGNWISYEKGTSIYLNNVKTFCMNNCSFADDTYTQVTSGDDVGCWVWLEEVLDGCVVSNCTLIGSCRTSSGLLDSGDRELFFANKASSDKHYYLINNIIVAGTDNISWWINQNNAPSETYNYNTVYSTKAGSSPYNGNNDTSGKTASDFGSLAWDSTNHVWNWNGTLTGGYTAITASDFATILGSANAAFKSWLETEGVLNKDQLGNARGSGSWWPGAYQPE